MKALITIPSFFVKKLKNVPRESWVQQPQDAYIPFSQRDTQHLNIQYYRDVKQKLQTRVD